MKHQDPAKLENAFLVPGCMFFSELINRISDDASLKPERARDMISGLRRIAKALDRSVSEVPVDVRWLQPRLNKVAPAALGLNPKSWQNIVSNGRAAMAHLGVVQKRTVRTCDLSPEWQVLWHKVRASDDTTLPALRRFVVFLSGQGIKPHKVTDAHALHYLEAVTLNEISKCPETAYRAAVNNWNLAAKRISGWPKITLSLPSRQKVIIMEDGTYPDSFHADLDALMKRLETPDPLDPRGPQKALRPQTLFQYRRQVLRFAAELVHSGMEPDLLINVRVLLDPGHAEQGLRHMLLANDNQSNRFIADTAGLLRNLGRIMNLDDEVREQLSNLAKRLKMPVQKGMTKKNRDRLRVLLDPHVLGKLLTLPEKLFKGAGGSEKPYVQALACEDAVAIALLLYCPIRAKNLVSINLDQHIQRPGDGRAYLVFNDEDTKTGQPIEFEIPQEVLRMIDRHLATRSPAMCPAGTPWLFPRRNGAGHVTPDELSGRMRRRIHREVGIEMNAHLFRHLSVMLWLEANPGAYEAARRLLGHADVSQTINLYSGLETRSAMAQFSDLITSKKGALS